MIILLGCTGLLASSQLRSSVLNTSQCQDQSSCAEDQYQEKAGSGTLRSSQPYIIVAVGMLLSYGWINKCTFIITKTKLVFLFSQCYMVLYFSFTSSPWRWLLTYTSKSQKRIQMRFKDFACCAQFSKLLRMYFWNCWSYSL